MIAPSERKTLTSGIEVTMYRLRLPHVRQRISEQWMEVRAENPELSAQFRALPPLLLYEDTVRVSPGGGVWATFIREDLKVVPEDKKPNTVYGVERVNRNVDIDTAARSLGHVQESYEKRGAMTRYVINVIEEAQEISYELQQSGITDEDLKQMSDRAMSTFVNSKFATSKSPEKLKTITQTLKALSRDSRNHINPPRSRMIVAQLREPLVRMLFYGRTIRNKNERRRIGVLQEREMERAYMKFIQQRIDQMIGLSVGDGSFDRGLRNFLKFAHSHLSPHAILVRPYAPVAAEARFLLFANDREAKGLDDKTAVERLTLYVGEERAEELSKERTFKEIDADEKKARLLSISSMLQRVMDRSDERLNKSADELLFEEGTLFNPGDPTV